MSSGRIVKSVVQNYPIELEEALIALCQGRLLPGVFRLSDQLHLSIERGVLPGNKPHAYLYVVHRYGPSTRQMNRYQIAWQSPKHPFAVEPLSASVTGFLGRKLKWPVVATKSTTKGGAFMSHTTFRAPDGPHCRACPQVLACRTAVGL